MVFFIAQALVVCRVRGGLVFCSMLQVVFECFGNLGSGSGTRTRSRFVEGVLGSVWFLCNRYIFYFNLYFDQFLSEDWIMEERFRFLIFYGFIFRSQLVTLFVRGVCYFESQSVSFFFSVGRLGGIGVGIRVLRFREREVVFGEFCLLVLSSGMCSFGFFLLSSAFVLVTQSRGVFFSVFFYLVFV